MEERFQYKNKKENKRHTKMPIHRRNSDPSQVFISSIQNLAKNSVNPEAKKTLNELENYTILNNQEVFQEKLKEAINFIAHQNDFIINQNNCLHAEANNLRKTVESLTVELEKTLQILEEERRIKKEKENARIKRRNRVRKPKTQPLTRDLFNELLKSLNGKGFLKARLRCAFTILAITGIRYGELNHLKVKQIQCLITNYYCPIDRKKRGPANLKAFLREPGTQLIKERKEDFDLLIRTKYENTETPEEALETYMFSAEKTPFKPLARAFFNNMLNKALNSSLAGQYTTHSFRHNFITELWRDSNDIEYVRQSMGHQHITSTAVYIKEMSDSERLVKLKEIDEKIKKQNKRQQKKNSK